MNKYLVVSLLRIQWNSAGYINKLENSVLVYGLNSYILSSSDAANGSLKNLLIEFHPKTKQVYVART